jgi:hypothetical protein
MPHTATHGYSSEEIDDMINESDTISTPTPGNRDDFFDLFGDFLFNQGGAQGLAGLGLLTGAYGRLGSIGERGLGLGQQLAEQQMQQAACYWWSVYGWS